jgi:exosortase/archaeosortase family protein
MKKKDVFGIFLRYILILASSLSNFFIFYFIFSPLTIYPVYWILNIFFNASLQGSTILINGLPIELIDACIAGSAYFLLFALNLSLPKARLSKRINMVLFAFAAFLIINVLRIFFLSLLYLSGSSWFDFTHKIFWYAISIIFVVLIWFAEVKLFKVKKIPFYSDIKFFYKESLFKN